MTTQPKPAKVLNDQEASAAFDGPRRRCKDGSKFPWSVWFDGKARLLSLKEHFPTFKSLKDVDGYIRLVARRHGYKVRCRRYEEFGQIAVQAVVNELPQVQDAPVEDMENKGKRIRRTVRDGSPPLERRQQQPRRKTG